MIAALVLIALAPAVLGAAVDPSGCATMCFALYDPVCGSDGQTYSNECMLNVAKCSDNSVTLAHHGKCGAGPLVAACPMVMCTMNYDPVCGTDGKTYSNLCALHSTHCHGDVTVAHMGDCDGMAVSK